ncbi:MAG TPA: hypothetical protein VFV08_05390, partial [Puia sp.]|nr:hypothetical protein [Puia sp.]
MEQWREIFKQGLCACILLVLINSCRKTADKIDNNFQNDFDPRLRNCLRISLLDSDFKKIDWTHYEKYAEGNYVYSKFVFIGKNPSEEFLLLQSDSTGDCINAKIIQLRKTNGVKSSFDGNISVLRPDRSLVLQSQVSNGYVKMLHPRMNITKDAVTSTLPAAGNVVPDPYDELPEVIVTAYEPSAGGPLA